MLTHSFSLQLSLHGNFPVLTPSSRTTMTQYDVTTILCILGQVMYTFLCIAHFDSIQLLAINLFVNKCILDLKKLVNFTSITIQTTTLIFLDRQNVTLWQKQWSQTTKPCYRPSKPLVYTDPQEPLHFNLLHRFTIIVVQN